MKKCYVVELGLAGNGQDEVATFVFTSEDRAEKHYEDWFNQRCEEVGYTQKDLEEIWEDENDGLVQDPEGEFWARIREAFLSSDYDGDTVEKIVDWIIKDGTESTDNGSWIVYYSEIINVFGVTRDWLVEHDGEIRSSIEAREEVADEAVGFEDECFDLVFYMSYCKNWDGTEDWGC